MKSDDALAQAKRHHQAGRLDRARALYARLLDDAPERPDVLHLLGVLTLQSGDAEGGEALIRRAIVRRGNDADFHANLGMALRALGRPDDAAVAYERALELNPEHANAHYNLGNIHRLRGDRPRAIAALKRSVRLDPASPEVRGNLAALLLESADPGGALEQCDACLALSPRDRLAIGYKAAALQGLSAHEEACDLLRIAMLVKRTGIETPAGYDDPDHFNRCLAAHVLSHPSLASVPSSKATKNGRQTGDLLEPPKGPFADFETVLNTAVARYLSELPQDSSHPYLAVRPRRWRLDVWAVVLETSGHQSAHMHPGGWVSGVYYVSLPPEVNERDIEGWIEFGRPPTEFGEVLDCDVCRIQPVTGELILFPSYLFHQTVPFASSEQRISVAFDAIPLE